MKVSECVICMKEFTFDKGKKVCCSKECASERHRLLVHWKYVLGKRENPKNRTTKKAKVLSIAEVNRLARKEGMTYGEYLARVEGGMR